MMLMVKQLLVITINLVLLSLVKNYLFMILQSSHNPKITNLTVDLRGY